MLNCFDGFSRFNLSRLIYIYIWSKTNNAYPFMSSIEPRRPFLLWPAVIGNGLAKRLLPLPPLSDDHLVSPPEAALSAPPSAPRNKAPNGSLLPTS